MSYEIIRADIEKDRTTILDFWNQNNEKKINKKFDWFYLSNPDGLATTYFIKHSDTPGIVGMASIFPRKFVFKQDVYTAGIQGDFLIHPDHRSFGPALMLIKAIVNSLEDSEYDFLYGFPNRKAELIFRRAGYHQLGSIKKYTRLFDIHRLLSSKAQIPRSLTTLLSPVANLLLNFIYPDTWSYNFGRYKAGVTNKLDFDITPLTTQYNHNWFTSQKSPRYLEWKYEQDPDDDNKYFYLKDRMDRIVGCIIFCHEEQNLVQIREILHTNDQYSLTSLLGLFFKKIKKDSRCEYAYTQMYENSGILRSTNNLDLTVSGQGRKIFYAINKNKASNTKLSQLLLSSHLCLMESDEDS